MSSWITGLYQRKVFVDILFFSMSVMHLLPVHSERGGARSVMALVGDDAILPIQLSPPQDANKLTVEWSRDDVFPTYVHISQDGWDLYEAKNPAFRERTVLSGERLQHGDVSLKLLNVQLSDQGLYICNVRPINQVAFVRLIVGSVSSPVIRLLGLNDSGLVLGCQSKGWYPEPEVSWLDGEGNLLPAGPTETVQGSDGLYTINSTVTVQETDTNRFTCKLQQVNLNQTREEQIHVPEDFFASHQSFWSLKIIYPVLIGLILIPVFISVSYYKKVLQRAISYLHKGKGGSRPHNYHLDTMKKEPNKEQES